MVKMESWLNDAVRVSLDPTFRLLGSKKNRDRGGALTSRLQSFEAGLPAGEGMGVELRSARSKLKIPHKRR